MLEKIEQMLKFGGKIEFGENEIAHSDGFYRVYFVEYIGGESYSYEVGCYGTLQEALEHIY